MKFLGACGLLHAIHEKLIEDHEAPRGLLEKDVKFIFTNMCLEAFNMLKENLSTASIIVAPNRESPLNIMTDASDYVVGAVLRQQRG